MHYFIFRKPLYWHSDNLPKKSHPYTLFVIFKYQKFGKSTLIVENKQNILDQCLAQRLDQFLTQKPPNIGPLQRIYIYIYML